MGLFDNYLQAFNKTLSSSLFEHDDAPNYSLLSESLTHDGEDSPFAHAFNDESPISELVPAENKAQEWTRKSEDSDSDLYFTNMHEAIIGKATIPKPTSRVPQGVDISSLTPQDEWDARFAPNQPLLTGTGPATKSKPKPGSYADRKAFAQEMKMSHTDYFNYFGRINAAI